jgi:hypothetical protein
MYGRRRGPEANCMMLSDVEIGVSRVKGFYEMIDLW